MRVQLFYDPWLLLERLGEFARNRIRSRKIRQYGLRNFHPVFYDSLELLELVKDDVKVIYDVGSNRGTWTKLAYSVIRPERIICFEPLDDFKSEFEKNTAGISEVDFFSFALGNQTGEETIQVAGDSSSILPLGNLQTIHFGVSKKGEKTIPIRKLDDLFSENKLQVPDLIKLDVQGYELEVMKGGMTVIRQSKYILIEVSFYEFYVGQPLVGEIITFLNQMGFHLEAISANTPTGQKLYQTDVLFRNKGLDE
jgi:FkbM family methyltransferase